MIRIQTVFWDTAIIPGDSQPQKSTSTVPVFTWYCRRRSTACKDLGKLPKEIVSKEKFLKIPFFHKTAGFTEPVLTARTYN